MSNKSDANGRANEYAYFEVFANEIRRFRPVSIIKNKQFEVIKKSWDSATNEAKNNYINAAEAAFRVIADYEPLICEKSDVPVILRSQTDKKGEEGDVRDIVISIENISWEIGISAKHNHFAVKHSRLSDKLDFSKKWFGYECTQEYKDEIHPIFERLKNLQRKGAKWSEVEDKEETIYYPIINAFIKEVKRQYEMHGKEVPSRLMEYLFAMYDFYKSIGIDKERMTRVLVFNFKGTLGKNSKKLILQNLLMPSRIIFLDFIPGKKNTAEMCLDNGWQFTFRIHNASSKVEPSLKFDIQNPGIPSTIITIDEYWS